MLSIYIWHQGIRKIKNTHMPCKKKTLERGKTFLNYWKKIILFLSKIAHLKRHWKGKTTICSYVDENFYWNKKTNKLRKKSLSQVLRHYVDLMLLAQQTHKQIIPNANNQILIERKWIGARKIINLKKK